MRQIRNEVPRKTFDFRVGFRLFAVIDSYKGDVAPSIFLKFTFITGLCISKRGGDLLDMGGDFYIFALN